MYTKNVKIYIQQSYIRQNQLTDIYSRYNKRTRTQNMDETNKYI